MTANGIHPLRVVVVGGGITGLLLAQGLQKVLSSNGYQVRAYERDAHLNQRDRDWTMSIHWSLPSLRRILPEDILADIHLAYTDQSRSYDNDQPPIPFYNGITGQVLHRVPAPNLRRLSRARFRELCARGLDVRLGKKLVGMSFDEKDDGPVTLRFEGDEEPVEADLVIGADGTNSKVRRLLIGEEDGVATASEWCMYNGVVCYGDAEKARFVREPHPLCTLAFTEQGLAFCGIQNVPNPDAPETWSFNILRFAYHQLTTSLTGDVVIERLKSMSHTISEPFRSAIDWIPPTRSNFFATQLRYWVTKQWDNRCSRVTLAGDAAHAMLPARGQGMNALEDVGRFVALMDGVKQGAQPLPDALGIYEKEVVERGRDVVVRSLEDCRANMMVAEVGKTRLVSKGLDA
ncbi:hypothetical protein GE09DRAFT_1173527 [Coniochaeta sp. 2T2.1]|nr:hypothetical protein GE09DRAFT_1173527 [Coniochaeta sp. 2T2.1]